MAYKRFEELLVWKDSAMLAADIFRWSNLPVFRGKGDLANQLQRATLSIPKNIAEGFERGTNKDLIVFLYYSKGSAGEVRSMLCVMDLTEEFTSMSRQIEQFRKRVVNISKQLSGWLNNLQNSELKGIKHVNDKTRELCEREQRAREFMDKIGQMTKENARKQGFDV